MPIYEFRCAECGTLFDERRAASDYAAPAPACPNGHAATRRVLSVFTSVGSSAGTPGPAAPAAGGGCGPGCACAASG
jgi:putative FmdB family regulatory protein